MTDFVAVRTPSQGTLTGDLVQRHPGSRITSVPMGAPHGGRLDHLALVEGIPPSEVGQLLLAWNMRYGLPAEVLGHPFALRLPVVVQASVHPWDVVLAAGDSFTVAGAVVEGDHIEQWYQCGDQAQAQRIAGALRQATARHPAADVIEGRPKPRDLECWAVLNEAVALEALTAPTPMVKLADRASAAT